MADPNCIIAGHVSSAGTASGATTLTVQVDIMTSTGTFITSETVTTGYLGYWVSAVSLSPGDMAAAGKAVITYRDTAGNVLMRDSIPLKFSPMFVFRQTCSLMCGALNRLGRKDLQGMIARILNVRSDKFFGVAGWGGEFSPAAGQVYH
jgi:hypothetical protein